MDNHEIVKLRKKIKRLIRYKRLGEKQIILFGAAQNSKEMKRCLREYGLYPSAIIDNDSRKIGKESLGMMVQKPESMLLPFCDSVAILLYSVGYWQGMVDQLQGMGYQEGKQVFCLNSKADESLPWFLYNFTWFCRGLWWHQKLRNKYSKHHTIFVAPYTGTGDIYLIGLFFQAYLKKNGISQYTFVVISGACFKVAEMFGIQNIEKVYRLAADDMIKCNQALRAEWNMVVLNDSWAAEHANLLQWIRGYKNLSFDQMFRHFVFQLEDSTAYQLPDPTNFQEEVGALFQKYNLVKGKTVVLSPYSNTLFELPDAVWKEIVTYCKEQGYCVCTNCAGADENPIAGTAEVFFPLGQAIEFMNTAGYFIGVRSGLCDIISSSSCKKLILYEKDAFFYKCSPFDYFSLKRMRLCDDAIEFEYRSDCREELIHIVKKIL